MKRLNAPKIRLVLVGFVVVLMAGGQLASVCDLLVAVS